MFGMSSPVIYLRSLKLSISHISENFTTVLNDSNCNAIIDRQVGLTVKYQSGEASVKIKHLAFEKLNEFPKNL